MKRTLSVKEKINKNEMRLYYKRLNPIRQRHCSLCSAPPGHLEITWQRWNMATLKMQLHFIRSGGQNTFQSSMALLNAFFGSINQLWICPYEH